MRIGTLCYATNSGLGILAKSFFDNDVITDPVAVEHAHHQTNYEWYPYRPSFPIRQLGKYRKEILLALEDVDCVLFFETPFDWELIPLLQQAGKKVVLMPMHECMPRTLPAQPDAFFCPSLLDFQVYHGNIPLVAPFHHYTSNVYFTPVPVGPIPWRLRERAEVFVHNAGHGGLNGRNGTAELLDAIQHVKSPAKFILRGQKESLYDAMPNMCTAFADDRVEVYHGNEKYDQLFAEGDVFLFPEKFNGLSLPLQEARAAGMLVMCGDRFPMNTWLPTRRPMVEPSDLADIDAEGRDNPSNPLIPVKEYRTNSISGRCVEFQETVFDPRDIAAKVDEWYGRDISPYSEGGRQWAEENSWAALKPRYLEVLEQVCQS